MQKSPCSVLVLTRNSAATLERCIGNLSAFGEILIHDANSEDDTVAIAKRLGAKVLKQYDTDEKSVRVTNFTEIRLKQRFDAAFDWVLYLDSDETMTEGLIDDVRSALQSAQIKTILQFRRMPVIDGVIRTHGVFYPEIVPRVHHRQSGCTLKAGKVVHEKYVYDATFMEVILDHPLCFPLPDVKSLRSKDDRYLLLEAKRIEEHGYPLSHFIRYILFWRSMVIVWMAVRILGGFPRYFTKDVVPFAHEWRYVGYNMRYMRAVAGAMITYRRRLRAS